MSDETKKVDLEGEGLIGSPKEEADDSWQKQVESALEGIVIQVGNLEGSLAAAHLILQQNQKQLQTLEEIMNYIITKDPELSKTINKAYDEWKAAVNVDGSAKG